MGSRGVPGGHGGFETFAENLALYLVEKGWLVTVYCQESFEDYQEIRESEWHGVRRVHIPVSRGGAIGTIIFDFLTIRHAARVGGPVLTLGYNTAAFNAWFRVKRIKNLINMDGIEWRREKWRWYEKAWLRLNERLGCLFGNHLVADHPGIREHLLKLVRSEKITMIPYGAREVMEADDTLLRRYDLEPKGYAIVIARPEPENSILDIVAAFSAKKRGVKLVVLGNVDKSTLYQSMILDAASDEVCFLGAIYDHDVLDALRFYALLYVHGHKVGGTNPSLVEALGSGQPILAHDNDFNRWVAQSAAVYFNDAAACERMFDALLDSPERLENLATESRARFTSSFQWSSILSQYELLISKVLG
jgi:glycosyltransferase involved in cell wall biosynthesis